MRILGSAVIALSLSLSIEAADAQTYGGSSYPVCLQTFGRFPSIDCSYASIEQCRPSAAARAAQCIVNPYAARSERPRRHRYYR
jgi:hypothetical protein